MGVLPAVCGECGWGVSLVLALGAGFCSFVVPLGDSECPETGEAASWAGEGRTRRAPDPCPILGF